MLILIEPPILIVMVFTIAILVSFSKRIASRARRIIVLVATLTIYLLSTGLVSRPTVYRMEHALKGPYTCMDTKVIVVLGAGINKGLYDDQLSKAGSTSISRLLKGLSLSANDKSTLIISGFEAPVLNNVIAESSFRIKRVFIDAKSKNTKQNLEEINAIVKKENLKNIAIVTSAIHANRVSKLAKGRLDFKYCIIPTDYKAHKGFLLEDVIPSIKNMELNYIMFYEILSSIKNRTMFKK